MAEKEISQATMQTSKTISKGLVAKIDIPAGVQIKEDAGIIEVTGKNGKSLRNFAHLNMKFNVNENTLSIESLQTTKKGKCALKTTKAHIKNMIRGVQEGWEKKLKIIYQHFPIQLKQQGDTMIISNFLGERAPRSAKIKKGTTVEVKGADVIIKGNNKEDVGCTAANIEKATKILNKDRRTFQDGIFIVEGKK